MSKTDAIRCVWDPNAGDTTSVLIVDNDSEAARFMLEILARKGIRANLVNDGKAVLDFLDKNSCDLVFISKKFPVFAGMAPLQGQGHPGELSNKPQSGFELLRKIRANSPDLPVIMIGEPAQAEEPEAQHQQRIIQADPKRTLLRLGIQTAVKAVRAGCCDFLIKPLDCKEIENLLDTFLPNHTVSTVASAQDGTRCLYQIVGRSPKLVQTINLAERIAPTSVPVLISGESGTGKELVSFLIHHKSKRTLGPYIKVNCAALSDSLLESELFGHEKGAFTGAYTQRRGRFEMAHGGTLLLDEITETPLKFQAKLLRILEQQEFERVGGNENVRVDVRIISTTNKDLLEEVQMGRFRQDLYYRLSGVRLVIAPLRQRREDLPDLVWHFVNLYAREAQRRITKLDPAMMDIFAKYPWPGNVRQLRNVVLTSLILGIGQTLSLADVSWLFDGVQQTPQIAFGDPDEHQPLSRQKEIEHSSSDLVDNASRRKHRQYDSGLGGVPLDQVERWAILDTLRQTDGNQAKAAKVLGISDRTLREKIRRYRQETPNTNKGRLRTQHGCLQSA